MMVRTRSASSGTGTSLRSITSIAERHRAAHPHALLLGGRDLVADALAGDLALELGEATAAR